MKASLGIRLQPEKVPTDVIVVDQVEKARAELARGVPWLSCRVGDNNLIWPLKRDFMDLFDMRVDVSGFTTRDPTTDPVFENLQYQLGLQLRPSITVAKI